MNDVSDVLAILNAGYEAAASAPAVVPGAAGNGWIPVIVEGIEFDCIRDAIRGFSDELMARTNILVVDEAEYDAKEYLQGDCLLVDGMYMYVNYSFDKAAALFAKAGLSFAKV